MNYTAAWYWWHRSATLSLNSLISLPFFSFKLNVIKFQIFGQNSTNMMTFTRIAVLAAAAAMEKEEDLLCQCSCFAFEQSANTANCQFRKMNVKFEITYRSSKMYQKNFWVWKVKIWKIYAGNWLIFIILNWKPKENSETNQNAENIICNSNEFEGSHRAIHRIQRQSLVCTCTYIWVVLLAQKILFALPYWKNDACVSIHTIEQNNLIYAYTLIYSLSPQCFVLL